MNVLHRIASLALMGMVVSAALADPPTGIVQDRKGFIPHRKQQAMPGTVIGVLVNDGQPILSTEGRSGPPDQLVFGRDAMSYRWVYVPTPGGGISNLQVPVGDKGEKDVFPRLDLAKPKNVQPWGMQTLNALVEVEVNSGKGCPAGDSFVATKIKVLDGTAGYALKVPEAIQATKDRHAAYKKEQQAAVDKAMKEAQAKALGDTKTTGPRETQDLMFVTWLTDKERLRIHFRTKVSDGNYTFVGGGVQPLDPPPLPPGRGGPAAQPPRPIEFKFKTGKTFGIEFGVAYEIGKDGKLVAMDVLPFEAFQEILPPPPAVGPGPRGGLGVPPLPPPPKN